MARPKVVDLKSGRDLETARIESDVAEAEDFSSILIEASMDGILTYDVNCRYTLWSPSMERITGLKSEDVLGRVAFEVFPFLKEVGIDKSYAATLNGQAFRAPVNRYTVPQTGAEGFTQQQNFPLFNERGEVTGGLAIVRDVTAIVHHFETLAKQKRELETRVKELEAAIEKEKSQVP